jgi:putative flippase GtrA
MPGIFVGSYQRVSRVYQTPSGKKIIRYTMVSVVSTAVSLGTLGIVFGLLHLWSEVPSAIFANVVATPPSYYLNRRWAWGKSGKSHLFKEVVPFWVASFVGLALSTWAAAMARDFSNSHHFHHLGHTVIVLGGNLGAYGVLWILKFLLFQLLFRQSPLADNDEGDEEGEGARIAVLPPAPSASQAGAYQAGAPAGPQMTDVENASVAEVGEL